MKEWNREDSSLLALMSALAVGLAWLAVAKSAPFGWFMSGVCFCMTCLGISMAPPKGPK